ncbi:MAG: DUF5916 domain-containing protein [Pyrinomonadaceae bacterium]
MNKLCVLAAILIFAVCIPAQTAKPPDGNSSETKENTKETIKDKKEIGSANIVEVPTKETKKSKIILPPEKANPVTIPKIESNLVIDGNPNEEIWKTAAVFKDFYQTGPGDNIAPSKQTEVLMMYDEKNLYFAFKCWDEKDKIRATLAKRDQVFGEDNVRLWLDTYNDQRRAYVLGFNPLGIQQDGILTEGQGADYSVDIVMESKGMIQDWGWTVEVKIPFKSLRYTAGKGKMWGFNAARNIDRLNDEFDTWMPDDRDISGFLIKHGKITGIDEIKYERTLELVPSITVSETGSRKRTIPLSAIRRNRFNPIYNPIGLQDPGRFVNDPIKADLGLTLKYTLSPNVTLDAAVNPDFAEIEADAPVVTANQRFPIFFQEKRPFFLEGKEIFDSPLRPFYSRTIVDPDVAAKLTGKIGKNSFGFLVATDNAPGNYSEDERNDPIIRNEIDQFVDKNALFSVLRLKHDIGRENNIGFFATARVFPQNRNFTGGFDGSFKLNPQTVMNFQILGTYSKKNFYDPVDDDVDYRIGNGIGYYWSLDYTTDTHGMYAEASGRSKDYRTDAGFTRRTNSNTFFFANRFSTKSNPKAQIIRANWNQFARFMVDWKGRAQGGIVGSNVNLSLQGNLFIYTEAGVGFEKIYEDEFGAIRNPDRNITGGFFGAPTRSTTQPYFSLNANKTVNKQLSVYGFVGSIINSFDFDFGAGSRFPRASPAFQTYLDGAEYREYLRLLLLYQSDPDNFPRPSLPQPPQLDPGKGWQFDLNVGGEYKPIDPLRISLDYTKSRLKRSDNGQVAYDTNIFSLRSTYQFTRFLYTRLRVDYDTLSANTSGQFLFGWNPNPGTSFYVGYNDNFNYKGYSPLSNQFENGFERNNRTFFIRASYLFRKSF